MLDNIVLAQEANTWAEESYQELVILFLDFEKAYDRINWTFLEQMMRIKGFAEEWIGWVRALYVDASTEVVVNGSHQLSRPSHNLSGNGQDATSWDTV